MGGVVGAIFNGIAYIINSTSNSTMVSSGNFGAGGFIGYIIQTNGL